MAEEAKGTNADCSVRHLRIIVYENPFAAVPFTKAFGTGPHDERFGIRDDRIRRVIVGKSLEALETEEHAAGVEPKPTVEEILGRETGT